MINEFHLIPANTELAKLEIEWNELLAANSEICFIHAFSWFASYIASHRDEIEGCYFLTVRVKGKLQAICPIQYREVRRLGVKLNLWQIFWSNDMRICDFIIRQNGGGNNFLKGLIDYLRRLTDHPWHMFHLQRIRDDSNLHYVIAESDLDRTICKYSHKSKFVACMPTYEESTANISAKFKRNNRRKLRKLQGMGVVSFSLSDTGEALNRAYENFLDVEVSSWKSEGNSAIKQKPKQRQFYQELVDRFSTEKKCLIHTLFLDDEPIASQFALISGDTLNLLKIGYNAKFSSMGPGTILLDETLRCFSGHAQIKKISFITGAKWNDDWAPHVSNVYTCDIYNVTIKGLAMYIFDKVVSRLRTVKFLRSLKHFAEQIRVKTL